MPGRLLLYASCKHFHVMIAGQLSEFSKLNVSFTEKRTYPSLNASSKSFCLISLGQLCSPPQIKFMSFDHVYRWVNRKDQGGNNVFEGGFLGLDNIGAFNRSEPLPTGGTLRQADGTAWMAFYCLNM